ncbi:hypothetical protein vseg_007970 [Gypsophila vaccaria]
MARKSNMHKQRELNLRGRSVMRPTPTKERNMDTREEEWNHSSCPNGQMKRPSTGIPWKMKDINEIIGITELIVETEDEVEEEVQEENPGEAKQSVDHENRVINMELENTETLLQLEQEDVIKEIEYWKNAVVCFILGANPP